MGSGVVGLCWHELFGGVLSALFCGACTCGTSVGNVVTRSLFCQYAAVASRTLDGDVFGLRGGTFDTLCALAVHAPLSRPQQLSCCADPVCCCAVLCSTIQVVMTTIEPRSGGRGAGYDAFEYISHSHTYISDNQPTAKFTYDLSPIQVRAAATATVWCRTQAGCGF